MWYRFAPQYAIHRIKGFTLNYKKEPLTRGLVRKSSAYEAVVIQMEVMANRSSLPKYGKMQGVNPLFVVVATTIKMLNVRVIGFLIAILYQAFCIIRVNKHNKYRKVKPNHA